MHEHISGEQIQCLLRGKLQRTKVPDLLTNLLSTCEVCRKTLVEATRGTTSAPPEIYSRAFDRALSTVAAREETLIVERLSAPGLAARLLKLPPARQLLLIHNDPRFSSWGLCERLIHESRQAIWDVQSDSLLELAASAIQVGEALDGDAYGERHVNDLLAEAHGNLANAYRVRSEFASSRQEFSLARELLAEGTGDASVRAQIDSLESSLLIDRGHFEDAVDLLERARKRIVALGERQLEGKLLVKQGMALGYFAPERAIEVQRLALESMDQATAPRLAACARQAMIWSLNAVGRSREALKELHGSRELFDQFSDSWSRLHYRWTEARIALDLGHAEEAQSIYKALADEALALDLRLEAALVALDLIEVEIALGRFSPAAALAGRLGELFTTWGVHRRAMQAWKLLTEAVRQEAATRALVANVGQYLRRAWKNPQIEFDS